MSTADEAQQSQVPPPTQVAAAPPASPLLAFEYLELVYVLGPNGEPREVGSGSRPIWSTNGRYLAWTELFEVPPTDGSEFGTWSHRAFVLDIATWERFDFETASGYEGGLLAMEDGFVAIISPEDRSVPSAQRFQVLDPAAVATREEPVIVQAELGPVQLAETGQTMHEFFWSDFVDGHLYVVVSGTAGTRYLYDPALWRVALDGSATRLFADCPGPAEGSCLNNYGMNELAVSPDQTHVAYQAGVRNGPVTDVYPRLAQIPQGTQIELRGLPESDEPASTVIGDVRWLNPNEFTMSVRLLGFEQGNQLTPTTQYRCTTAGDCTEGDPMPDHIIANGVGDQAVVADGPSDFAPGLVTVMWADRTERVISANPWSIAWSPVS